MKTTLSLLTILSILAGCVKPGTDGSKCAGNCLIITGKAIDTPSNTGLKGVELKFYHRVSGFTFFDPTTYLGRTVTDENGNYTFRFDGSNYKKGTGYFLIEPKKAGHFYTSDNNDVLGKLYLDSTDFNIPYAFNLRFFRQATLSITIKPTSGIQYQYLTILYQHGNNPSGYILNKNQIIDSSFSIQTAGDVQTIVQWDATGSGVRVSRRDTLFTTQGGTIQYRIDL